MFRNKFLAIGVAVVCAFIVSSLWYSPLIFGKQFLELSGPGATSNPSPVKVFGELSRNLILASAIFWLLNRRRPKEFSSALGFVFVLWIGFPVTLLWGSVMWQGAPLELAVIHSGDWLTKLLLMTMIPWFAGRRADTETLPVSEKQDTRRAI